MIDRLSLRVGAARFLVLAAVFLTDALLAANGPPLALEKPASYAGTLPCADCPGVDWHLDLWPTGRFHLRRDYRERDGRDDDIGRWRSNPADGSLLLFGGREAPLRLAVIDEATLRLLDLQGRAIESSLPYELRRLEDFTPAEVSLFMSGEFSYLADAASFRECRSGARYPVLMEGDYLALERQYLALRKQLGEQAPSSLLVSMDGSIVNRRVMESEGPSQSLRVDKFTSLLPRSHCEATMTPATLPNTYWRLLRLGDEPVSTVEGAREPHLVLHDARGAVAGFSGCNRFNGSYEVNGDALRFGPLASTMMACPESLMRLEQQFHRQLASVSRWAISGPMLELFDEHGVAVLAFEAVYLP